MVNHRQPSELIRYLKIEDIHELKVNHLEYQEGVVTHKEQ